MWMMISLWPCGYEVLTWLLGECKGPLGVRDCLRPADCPGNGTSCEEFYLYPYTYILYTNLYLRTARIFPQLNTSIGMHIRIQMDIYMYMENRFHNGKYTL